MLYGMADLYMMGQFSGAAGITAGLGLQASVSQFASGIQILINHPFKSGDYIDLGTVSGKVHEIKMMYTELITVDNKRVIVPNSHITGSNIINYNSESKRRIDLVFGISYDADIAKAKEVIAQTGRKNELIRADNRRERSGGKLGEYFLPRLVSYRRLLERILLYAGSGQARIRRE